VAELERGVRPWFKPWNAEHAAGRITRPLRANGFPYQGMNVLMLWSEAVAKGYSAPLWMTYKQALDLGAHVRKGETGSLVVYADKITRKETDAATGADSRDCGQGFRLNATIRSHRRRPPVRRRRPGSRCRHRD
jgi:antirestriction protein ArdC